jgi:hypothetical protein
MTFIVCCSESVYECHDQRDTRKMIFEMRVSDLTFAMRTRAAAEANVKSPHFGKVGG